MSLTSKHKRTSLAQTGEQLVARALARQGWQILNRNFRHIGCEVDIAARKGETLIVVEVKVRRASGLARTDYGDLLPLRKRRALERGVQRIATLLPDVPATLRIDLALIHHDEAKPPALWRIEYFVGVHER